MKYTLWAAGLIAVFFITSCKNVYEKEGDEQLKAGKYQKALQKYKNVKDKGSKDFNDNLTMAYIGSMGKAYVAGADIDKLILYIEKIDGLMEAELKPATQKFYCETVVSIGGQLIEQGEFGPEEMGFILIKGTEKFAKTCGQSKSKIDTIKSAFTSKYLKEAEEHYLSIKKSELTEGIVADYIMNHITFFVDETPEIKELWSKIRKANLAIFLLYTYDGAVEKPIPALNRYSVLLAITKLTRSAKAATFQVQAFNNSTAYFKYISDGFTLVDREGKEYKPSGKRGGFSKTKVIEDGERTPVAEVTFKVTKGTELDYLKFDSKGGETRKYLP